MLTRLVHRAVSPAPQGRETGAGLVEYAGLVVLVFLVLVGLVASSLPLNISAGIDQELCQVFSSSYDCAHPPQAGERAPTGGNRPGEDQPGTGDDRPGTEKDPTGRPGSDRTGRPGVPVGHHPGGSDAETGSGDPVGGFFAGAWQALTDPLENLFKGVGGALLDAGKGMLDLGERLVTDPWGTVKSIGTGAYRALRSKLAPYAHQALRQWRDGDWLGALATSGKAIFTTQWDTLGLGGLWNMTVDEKVRAAWNRGDYLTAIGRGLTNAAMAVDPGTWFTKLGPISKAARAADKATRLAKGSNAAKQAAKAASKARHAAKHGNLPAAEKEFKKARSKTRSAKREAKKKGCHHVSSGRFSAPIHLPRGPESPCEGVRKAKQRTHAANQAINKRWAENVTFETKQIQHEWKHADKFGHAENYNTTNREAYKETIRNFMKKPNIKRIKGEYRKIDARFFYDQTTRRVVFFREDGKFWGAWQLNEIQERHLLNKGRLGGG